MRLSRSIEPSPQKKLGHFFLRFVMLALVLGFVLNRTQDTWAPALLPALQTELEWLDDTYKIQNLSLDREGADRVVRVVVSQARFIVLGDVAYRPHPLGRANASTLLGNVMLPAVLLTAMVLAWPIGVPSRTGRIKVALRRAAMLPLALTMLWSLDVPFVLWAAIWSLHVDAFAPGMFSPLLVWSQFLQGGGRDMLAIGLAVAVCSFA